ncbi:MAG: DNA repair protein RecO [Bacteroidetes bacterium CG2_30_33_31]|nr:MAG: DNA repair protein RecO [Bacteroidetes bacterium CG2_30_33_31]
MLYKSPAIVLSKMNYSESGMIVRLYTKKFGLLSILQKGIRTSKGKKASLFQPLSILEIVISLNEKKDLHFTREISLRYNLHNLHYDVVKTSLAFFISELISKSIHEREENSLLYDFLEKSILFLDETSESVSNFHLVFMLKYASMLGFGIENPRNKIDKYFDMQKGVFSQIPTHSQFLNLESSGILMQIIDKNYLTMNNVFMSNKQRNETIDFLIEFYYLHIEGIRQLKSKEVLKMLFE